MAKRIDIYNNKSLEELEFTPGELLAFDNNSRDPPNPLILAIPRAIYKGHERSRQGLRLLWGPSNEKWETWILDFSGRILELWSPRHKNAKTRVPNYSVKEEGTHQTAPYFIETAIAGREAIKNYLRGAKAGMDFYAQVLESGEFDFFLKPLKI